MLRIYGTRHIYTVHVTSDHINDLSVVFSLSADQAPDSRLSLAAEVRSHVDVSQADVSQADVSQADVSQRTQHRRHDRPVTVNL
jgi:hypothetical protein